MEFVEPTVVWVCFRVLNFFDGPDTVFTFAYITLKHILQQHELWLEMELSVMNIEVVTDGDFKSTVVVVESVCSALVCFVVGNGLLVHEQVIHF